MKASDAKALANVVHNNNHVETVLGRIKHVAQSGGISIEVDKDLMTLPTIKTLSELGYIITEKFNDNFWLQYCRKGLKPIVVSYLVSWR